MKVPLSWLKEFLPLTQTPREIALHLTNLGIEVEAITGDEATFTEVVVGKVLSAEKHPNADRLRVVQVTDGSATYQVVCGAPNCREGILVAFAREGAQLQDKDNKKWKIKKSKIRDVESCGMLCSSTELKLEGDAEGILELPAHTPLGTDLAGIVLDPIFDLSLTPNLGHCQSILGIARELAASFHLPTPVKDVHVPAKATHAVEVVIENIAACPRYSCRIVSEIKVGPSPQWMQERLLQCGLRPVNNVVDVSNYVMMEMGQPLHMFDLEKIEGNKIIIHQMKNTLSLITLDHVNREIPPETLLICDAQKPLALAGIMGGMNSAVSEDTHTVLIESALFSPTSIRGSSRLLHLKTDASTRFDKGIDEKGVVQALERATELLCQIAGAVAHPIVDKYPVETPPKTIPLRPARVEKMLGLALSVGEMIELLKRLGMQIHSSSDILHVTIPSYRNDLNIEIDLMEEIARLYGYNHIPLSQPLYSAGQLTDTPLFLLEEEIRALLLREGLQECITCDLISPRENELTKEKEMPASATLHVLHPRSIDQSVLRTSLLPGMIKVAQHNFNFQQTSLALFEVGRIHYKEKEKIEEPSCASILLSGLSRPPHFDRKPSPFDFLDLKGMIENLCHHLHIGAVQFVPSHLHTLHPWRQAQVKVGATTIGVFGQLHPQLAADASLHGNLFFAELNVSDILDLKKHTTTFHPLALYPSSTRDWTLTVSNHISYAALTSLIQSCSSPHLESFAMIDSFESQELGPDRKNLTFRFVYRDRHHTIAYGTVEEEHRQVIHSVAEKVANLI